jgi:hypothetical protein
MLFIVCITYAKISLREMSLIYAPVELKYVSYLWQTIRRSRFLSEAQFISLSPIATMHTICTLRSSNPTSGYISQAKEISLPRRYLLPMCCNTIHNSEDMELTYVSIDRWVDKENVVHIHDYYVAINKNEILSFVTKRRKQKEIASYKKTRTLCSSWM